MWSRRSKNVERWVVGHGNTGVVDEPLGGLIKARDSGYTKNDDNSEKLLSHEPLAPAGLRFDGVQTFWADD